VGSPDASEFQVSGPGYSPDRFYTQSKYGPNGERRWVGLGRQTVPAEMMAQIEDLIHQRKYPAYRSFGDFVRDAIVHHLHRRLTELDDPYWATRRDVASALFELERIEMEAHTLTELTERWGMVLENEHDPKRRAALLDKARDDVESLPSDYQREELAKIIKRYDRRG
jgi:hypothetical protein